MILQVGDIGLNANTKRLNYLRSQIIEPFVRWGNCWIVPPEADRPPLSHARERDKLDPHFRGDDI